MLTLWTEECVKLFVWNDHTVCWMYKIVFYLKEIHLYAFWSCSCIVQFGWEFSTKSLRRILSYWYNDNALFFSGNIEITFTYSKVSYNDVCIEHLSTMQTHCCYMYIWSQLPSMVGNITISLRTWVLYEVIKSYISIFLCARFLIGLLDARCLFNRVPEHGISQRMQFYYASKFPCTEVRQRWHCVSAKDTIYLSCWLLFKTFKAPNSAVCWVAVFRG